MEFPLVRAWLAFACALIAAVVQCSTLHAEVTAPSGRAPLYDEALRPQFHFTARYWEDYRLNPPQHHEGWMNDINGLVHHDGEYHFFAQRWWSAWLHAISTDLIHWEEMRPAFGKGGQFGGTQSGGAIVDHQNRSGLGDGKTPPIVAFWSSTDNLSQCISFSRDRGRTWTKYKDNPVLVHAFRDPKVFWYEPGQRWIMILYGPSDEAASLPRYGFNGESNDAHDLREWKPGEWNSSVIRFFPDGRVSVADQSGISERQISSEKQNLGGSTFQIGAKASGTEFLTGEIASVIVYDRPLTDDETSALIRSMESGEHSGLPSSGKVLHLDAAQAVAESDGTVVQWRDSSGNTHVARQADRKRRPLLVTPKDSGDRTALRFAGAESLVAPAVLAEGDDSFTIAAVWRRTNAGGSQVVCEQNSASQADGRRAALLSEGEGARENCYFLFSSTNLLKWDKLPGSVSDSFECPDMFELPVEGPSGERKWVIIDGNGDYIVGDFNGERFTQETEKRKGDYGRNFYATMTFENMPKSDPRRIQIAWMRGWDDYPKDMPFNQQASFPCELTLRRLPEGLTLCRKPIREIATLRAGGGLELKDFVLRPGVDPFAELRGELFDVRVVLDVARSTCKQLTLNLRGNEVRYDLERAALHSAGSEVPLIPTSGEVEIRILLDRLSLEAFGNDGAVSITNITRQSKNAPHMHLSAIGGDATLKSVQVYPLRSIWKK